MGNIGRGTTLNTECGNSSEKKPFSTSDSPKWIKPGIHCWFNLGLFIVIKLLDFDVNQDLVR